MTIIGVFALVAGLGILLVMALTPLLLDLPAPPVPAPAQRARPGDHEVLDSVPWQAGSGTRTSTRSGIASASTR